MVFNIGKHTNPGGKCIVCNREVKSDPCHIVITNSGKRVSVGVIGPTCAIKKNNNITGELLIDLNKQFPIEFNYGNDKNLFLYIYLRQYAIPMLVEGIRTQHNKFNDFTLNLMRSGNLDKDREHIENIIRKASNLPSYRPYNISILYKVCSVICHIYDASLRREVKENLLKYKMLNNYYIDRINRATDHRINYFDFTKKNEANS